jgi:hypothetical protein
MSAGSNGVDFFANTGSLLVGTSDIVQVTGFPATYQSSIPASGTFTWRGTSVALDTFVLTK